MNPSLRSIKTTTGPRITWKTRPFNELYTLASDTVELHWSADAIFNSCQLTITWTYIRMPTINLNTAWICLGHPVSNARSLQEIDAQSLKENSQSERTYYCRHIIRGAKKISPIRKGHKYYCKPKLSGAAKQTLTIKGGVICQQQKLNLLTTHLFMML